ncbi:MAG: hypothetical protein N2381_07105 [Armatimonadetes bacterium]|nr:hypothetical protein [Armatimonadota bacterium]
MNSDESHAAKVLTEALLQRRFSGAESCLIDKIFKDGAGARKALMRIVSDAQVALKLEHILDDLLEALKDSPDPDSALVNFERLCDAAGKLRLLQWLSDNRATIYALIKLLGTSNYAADTLCLHPEYLSLLFPVSQLGAKRGRKIMAKEAKLAADTFMATKRKWESLCRFRRRETLRIIAADILGMMRYEDVVDELTALAEATVKTALDIALQQVGASIPQEECGFLIVALGKLGGLELNYSSDIDLMFIYDRASLLSWALGSPSSKPDSKHAQHTASLIAEKLSQAILKGLSEVTNYGRAYRVDLRLRPYGRSGPMALEWGAMMSYYESWAMAWERMALIKARPIAGDVRLSLRFARFVESYVYMAPLEYDAFSALREIRRHSEEAAAASSRNHVKAGRGGIRDVEFVVQLLQLTFGSQFDSLKIPNTLHAIEELRKLSLLTDEEANSLRESYIFLRTLEHMLQIAEHLPMHELPALPDELEKVARRMGYAEEPIRSLTLDYRMHTERVRSIYKRVVDELDSIIRQAVEGVEAFTPPLDSDEELTGWLSNYGFAQPAETVKALHLLVEGPAEVKLSARERMAVLRALPIVVKAASKTVNPDAAIQRLEQLSTAVGNRAAFISSLCSNETALCMLLSCISLSEFLSDLMMRYPEHLETVLRESLEGSDEGESSHQQLYRHIMGAGTDEQAKCLLRRFKQRETLRIGFMQVNGILNAIDASHALATIADATIGAALRYSLKAGVPLETLSEHDGKIAILGLGGLGAQELHYASDLDLIFIHEAKRSDAEEVVIRLIKLLSDSTEDGVAYRVDVRLRPLGGTLLSHPEEAWAAALNKLEPWQLISLPRARHIAGDKGISQRLIERAWGSMQERFLKAGTLEELFKLWQAVQKEHAPPKDTLDPKYVRGGLSDLQFIATLIQLAHVSKHRQLRHHSYAMAIETAAKLRLLSEEDAGTMLKAHEFLRAMKSLITILKAPQIRSISINDASFPYLAMHLTGEHSPSDAISRLLSMWETVCRASHAAIMRAVKELTKSMQAR